MFIVIDFNQACNYISLPTHTTVLYVFFTSN